MSIQLATAPGALLALGLGAGDVATLFALARRAGNWWSASSGDEEMLSRLDENQDSILTRRGLLDILAFNNRWRRTIRLLANGEPLALAEEDIRSVLENPKELVHDLSIFTGVMTCVVATLRQYTSRERVKHILHNVLQTLFGLGDAGETLLRSEMDTRLSSWESMACLRCFTDTAAEIRFALIRSGSIQSGHFPESESKHVERFLVWLFGTNHQSFDTTSSDVAGIAFGLNGLGIDILHVQGDGFSEPRESACTVIYRDEPFLHDPASEKLRIRQLISRSNSITIPLKYPWECVSVFPVSYEIQNNCRSAWKAGQKAAEGVSIGVHGHEGRHRVAVLNDTVPEFSYAILNVGREAERTTPELNTLAVQYGLVMNGELLDGLDSCLGKMPTEILCWLDESADDSIKDRNRGRHISEPEMMDQDKVDAFCVFQLFFMGYYYEIFGRLVDTSTLVLQSVEGAWGFRSSEILNCINHPNRRRILGGSVTFPRHRVLSILTKLFLGTSRGGSLFNDELLTLGCLGVVDKRTLLTNSLLGKCSTPQDIGGFTLLDVDVGGVPRDHNGLVRPGQGIPTHEPSLMDATTITTKTQKDVKERGPDVDVTFNIEADWQGDPDTTLICVRYKGRRVTLLSPHKSDWGFCKRFVPPQLENSTPPSQRASLDHAIVLDLPMILEDGAPLPYSPDRKVPVLFQALDRPRLRYCAAALYRSVECHCKVATDSIQSALESALRENPSNEGVLLVAGTTDCSEDMICQTLRNTTDTPLYVITGPVSKASK